MATHRLGSSSTDSAGLWQWQRQVRDWYSSHGPGMVWIRAADSSDDWLTRDDTEYPPIGEDYGRVVEWSRTEAAALETRLENMSQLCLSEHLLHSSEVIIWEYL